ncbi:thiamine pyrophosphate-dependent enzyme [Klebsiella pneumoniae subsp. pneumoniae]|nr:thiamine pyrophosphate-dependent enzyme [Klebsiella pneumoniae subsp. pneumoniae]
MVVCVTGDVQHLQMNIQELFTALQYELPVLVLNLSTTRYLGMVKQWQDMPLFRASLAVPYGIATGLCPSGEASWSRRDPHQRAAGAGDEAC